MNTLWFLIYIFITLPIAIYLALRSRSDYKFVTFILVYWLFAGTILNTENFIIDIESWYFDIQPPRFIFIILTLYLFVKWGMRKYKSKKDIRRTSQNNNKFGSPAYEKFLYIFLIVYLIANVAHLGHLLTVREILASFTTLLVFPVIYLVLKETADCGMIKTITKTFLIVCVISSVIGMYQFFIDPYFFRIGAQFIAFGENLRANGIYRAEYLQGSFLLSGIIIALTTIESKKWKFLTVLLFLLGITLTFHRATWIITLLIFAIYLIKVKKIKIWRLAILGIFLITFFYLLLDVNRSFIEKYEDSSFVRERLLSDTITGRILLYNMALHQIPEHLLFGVGSPKSDIYYREILRAGGSEEEALGMRGGIHNLYLLMAYFYGLPAAFFFTIFCITTYIYYWKKINKCGVYYFIPAAIIVVYIMQNLINMLHLYHDFGLLLAIFLGVSVAIYQRNIGLNEFTNDEGSYK